MFSKYGVATVALLASILAQPALAGDDFTVTKGKNRSLGDVTDITVTSRLDAVTITDVSVNRGNCSRLINSYGQELPKPVPPIKMKFGTSFTIGVAGFCNPLEIELKTDKGTFRTGWER